MIAAIVQRTSSPKEAIRRVLCLCSAQAVKQGKFKKFIESRKFTESLLSHRHLIADHLGWFKVSLTMIIRSREYRILTATCRKALREGNSKQSKIY